MHNQTTKYPVILLCRYIKQQGIVYDDICHEVADHIICTLEEDSTVNEDNFYDRLNAFMHSHRMVAMIATAKEQMSLRETAYRKEIGNGVISAKGIIQLAAFVVLIYAAFQNDTLKILVQAGYVVCMLIAQWAIGFSRGVKAFSQYNKLLKQTRFYIAAPILLLWATYKFLDEESLIGEVLAAACIGFMLNILLLTWQVNKNHNRKYYA